MTRFSPTPLCVALTLTCSLLTPLANAQTSRYPITDKQRSTANQVAQQGVPLSELRDNAPDTYTIKPGDTLWDISKIFLKSPWRWPELWGMNLAEIKNPHLIYPGQILHLDKSNGRARLRLGKPLSSGTLKLKPGIRTSDLSNGIPSVPMAQIEPFLNDAIIFDTNALAKAPRIVATQEGHAMLSRGDLAYVRGDLEGQTNFRVFREPKPLLDPVTQKILGYEAVYLGAVEYTRSGDGTGAAKPKDIVPDTFTVTHTRQEIRVGDRLYPTPEREFTHTVPHAPKEPIMGQIASVYGEAVSVGQNQIVALNRGEVDGIEPGHVLALWHDGARVKDTTTRKATNMKLPDERHGTLFVFRVFKNMSYALILTVQEPVNIGDRFTQP